MRLCPAHPGNPRSYIEGESPHQGKGHTVYTVRRRHAGSECSNDPRCSRGALVHRVAHRRLWNGHWRPLFVETLRLTDRRPEPQCGRGLARSMPTIDLADAELAAPGGVRPAAPRPHIIVAYSIQRRSLGRHSSSSLERPSELKSCQLQVEATCSRPR